MVTEPTREDYILDLMLTNNPSSIKSVHILPGFSDHEFVLSDSNLLPAYARKLPMKIHLCSKANWAAVLQKISEFSVTYFNTTSKLDINTKWNTLKKQMNDIVDTCIPSKMTTKRHKAPWINGTLIRLTRKKQRLFNKSNKKKGNNTWSSYKSCNKQVTQQMRKARSDCVNKIIESAFQEADTKLFWKLIHSKRGEKLESCHWSPRGNCFLTADQKLRL